MKKLNENKSGPCPAFFRGNVMEARRHREGYALAGYHLAIHARELVPLNAPESAVEDLACAVVANDPGEQLWLWLQRTLPRCMALVPARRKRTFLKGVLEAIEEGRV